MIKTLKENTLGRDFVVGDLHGMYFLLEEFLDYIEFMPQEDRMISVGDLVDRGPWNVQCLQLLAEPWFHAVLGNHEEMMVDYLLNGPYGIGAYWHHNGGGWFQELSKEDKEYVYSILDKVKDLPWLITVEGPRKFHVLHAELRALRGCEIRDSDLEDEVRFTRHAKALMGDGEACLWGRELWGTLYGQFLDERKVGKLQRAYMMKPSYFNEDLSHIYSGHITLRQPTTIGGQTDLDTGAFRIDRYDDKWAGLTFTEPVTGKFWTVKKDGVHSVEPLIIV